MSKGKIFLSEIRKNCAGRTVQAKPVRKNYTRVYRRKRYFVVAFRINTTDSGDLDKRLMLQDCVLVYFSQFQTLQGPELYVYWTRSFTVLKKQRKKKRQQL